METLEERFPFLFNTQADYNTNSKSYYDQLAKYNKVLHILAKMIDEYDGKLDNSLENIHTVLTNYTKMLDGKLAGFDDSVMLLLREWIDDGTFEMIINTEIFNHKLDTATFNAYKENADSVALSFSEQLAEVKTFKQVVYLSEYPRLENETDDRNRFIRLFSAMDNVQELEVMVENENLIFSVPKNGYGIRPPENTTINSHNSEYHVEMNGNPNYYLIDISNDNIVFNGGVFVGDRETHDFTESGSHEWGHCFSINGALNVEINNVKISEFTGDGVYVGTLGGQLTQYELFRNKVLVYNSEIFNCRRQGISLINGQLDVIDCKIHNINGTAPSAAIDIEPNNVNEYTDLYVKNLNAYDCAGGGLMMYASYTATTHGNITNLLKYHRIVVDGLNYVNHSETLGRQYGIYISYQEKDDRSGGIRGRMSFKNIKLKNSAIYVANWSEENPRITIDDITIKNSDTFDINAVVSFIRGSSGYYGVFNIGGLSLLNYDIYSPNAKYGIILSDDVGSNGIKRIVLEPLRVVAKTKFLITPTRIGDEYNFIDPLNVHKYRTQLSIDKDVVPVGNGMTNIIYDATGRRIKTYKNNNYVHIVGKFKFTAQSGNKTFVYFDGMRPLLHYTAFGTVQPMRIPISLYSSTWVDGYLTFDSTGFIINLASGGFVDGNEYQVFLNFGYLTED